MNGNGQPPAQVAPQIAPVSWTIQATQAKQDGQTVYGLTFYTVEK